MAKALHGKRRVQAGAFVSGMGQRDCSFVPLRRNEPPLWAARDLLAVSVRYSGRCGRGARCCAWGCGARRAWRWPATGLAQYGHTVHDGSSAWPQWEHRFFRR